MEIYLKEYVGNCYEIAESADVVYIGSDFPDEFTGSTDTKGLKGAKANSVQGMSELIQIATNKIYSPNYKEKHKINARMLVRHAEDGNMYLYDLLRIKKEASKPHEQ